MGCGARGDGKQMPSGCESARRIDAAEVCKPRISYELLDVSSAALAFRSLWRDERESMNCTWLLERLTSVAPKKAVSMATPHSPAVRPAADCEFLQGQKERNSSVHLVKRNVLPFIRETAGLCGYMKE